MVRLRATINCKQPSAGRWVLNNLPPWRDQWQNPVTSIVQHFKVEQRQPVQLAHQRKHTAIIRRSFAQDRHQLTQPHQADRIKPGQDHPAIIDQYTIGFPQQTMRIATPRQGVRQQAGVNGLFGKG